MTHPPATHRNDPATAYAAEERMNTSGKRQAHWKAVLAAVTAAQGKTAKEYGVITGLGHHEAQRRLSDLEAKGEVVKAAPDVYEGSKMVTWRLPGAGKQIEMEL